MILYNTSTDPYFNLACEEYLLDSDIREEIFMLWRNAPTVVIGRNQNAYAELNADFIASNHIAVVRRLTGGGAVFHDLGNVNYSFITPEAGATNLDFERFCKPVIAALGSMGLEACMSGRNDILADGRKISGTAQCVRNGKILHHGTLLYSADMTRLAGALNVNAAKIQSKGIKSVRSRVANICDLLPEDKRMPVTAFIDTLFNYFGGSPAMLSPEMVQAVQKLSDEKYSKWEWNYGQSKQYSMERSQRFDFGTVEILLDAEKGVIQNIQFRGDFFGRRDVSELSGLLTGQRLERENLIRLLTDAPIGEYIMGAAPGEIASLIV